MTDTRDTPPGAGREIDLQQVERLIAAIEEDLAKVRSGSESVEALRSEVDSLKQLLDASGPSHEPVHDRLRSIHSLLDELVDDAVQGARYVAEIGRMLGM
jgi:predicted  nucleic acid-binding Zn-ribbon protein